MANPRLNLVVAACQNRGIGMNGNLPWPRLKGDLAFLKRITTETKDPEKQNAIIIGRKTYESFPVKRRPLPNRVNVILTRNEELIKDPPSGAYAVGSLDEALRLLTTPPLVDKVESLYCLGGAEIYKIAVDHPSCHRIYITQVYETYKCDAFMCEFDTNTKFKAIKVEGIDDAIQEDNGVKYKYEIYEKASD